MTRPARGAMVLRRDTLLRAALAGCLVGTGLASRAQSGPTGGLTLETPGRISSAPLFAAPLVDLDQRPAPLQRRPGRPMIVNFWARWCGPCREEIPELVALHARKTGVDVLGINLENDPEPVRDFARAYDVNYPLRMTREGGLELMRALGNPKAGLPFTLVLDGQQAVVALRLGVLRREHLDAAVQRALRLGP
jgi:thiol-disulfide isomerase/thioredoxin